LDYFLKSRNITNLDETATENITSPFSEKLQIGFRKNFSSSQHMLVPLQKTMLAVKVSLFKPHLFWQPEFFILTFFL
jgi:hypothetical protein